MNKALSIPEFQKFAAYLLAKAPLQDQLKNLHFKLLQEADLPLFSMYDQQEIRLMASKSLLLFLEHAVTGQPPELAVPTISNWIPTTVLSTNTHPAHLTVKDIVRICRVRKQLFLEFVKEYTANVEIYASINNELEQYFCLLEEQVLEHYIKKKQEEVAIERAQKEDSKIKREELEELHYLLQEVSGAIPHIVYVLDIQTNSFLYSNKDIGHFFGYTTEEFLGSYNFLKQIVHPDDREILEEREQIYFKLNPGEFVEVQIRVQHKNGNWHWLNSKSKVFRHNEKMEPALIFGISEDITEVMEAEENIKSASNYYLQILEDFPALIWRSGKDGKCNYFNRGWLEFTGRSLEEEIGDGWIENVHPDDLDSCTNTYLHFFNAQQPFEMEYRLKRKDDRYRYIVDYGKPIYNLEGTFDGFIGSCFDIQERKNYQQLISHKNEELAAALNKLKLVGKQLQASNNQLEERVSERTKELASRENFLNSIIEQSPVATWIADKNGTTIQSNQACLNLFGWKAESECTGKYNILKDEALVNSPDYQEIVRVFTHGSIAKIELDYNIGKESEESLKENVISIIYTIFPIKNPEGEITNAVIKVENVTDKKKAEIELKRREKELRLITDSIPVLISYLDSDLRYGFVNKAYEKLFKKNRAEIIGKTLEEVAGTKAFKNILPAIEKVYRGEPQFLESHQDFGDLGKKYLSINFIPNTSQGQVVGFYAMAYDISERKKTEQELEALYEEAKISNEELNRINTDLDNFIYTASHDLKSPVANLEGLLILLEKNIPQSGDEKELKIIQMMEASVNKLKKTISDLVEITKIQKDSDQLQIEDVSFNAIMEDIKVDLMFLIEETKPEVEEDFQVESIQYAKSHLRSILYNLFSNALKYKTTERITKILVKSYLEGGKVVLLVRDNGLGMNESQQKKLFTMFKRMHTHVEGTGIGLYTIKRIIENNGGKIVVSSKEGEGTQFKITFKR